MGISQETQTMLNNGKGYRYENLYGNRVRNIKEVCMYEKFELCNTDIPNTILNLYYDYFTSDEIDLLMRLNNEEEITIEEKERFGDLCLNLAKKVTNNNEISSCVWLCKSKEDIVACYLDLGELKDEKREYVFDEYVVPSIENVCILSDIGIEGALLAYHFA